MKRRQGAGVERFDEAGIAGAPESAGAYRLYRGSTVIYIGVAMDLRRSLAAHLRGGEGACTRAATGFAVRPDEDPVGLQRRWLAEYGRENDGALPECNDRRRNRGAVRS